MNHQLKARKLSTREIPEAIYFLTSYAFHPSPPLQDKDEWLKVIEKRVDLTGYAVFENDVPLCTSISTDMRQVVRGKEYPMSGIWGVATHPQARRHGYAKVTLAALLKDNREAGHTFSTLYPFRESFYERLGYVTFPQPKRITLQTRDLAPLLNTPLDGRVDLMAYDESFGKYQQFLETYFRSRHGMSLLKTPIPPSPDKNPYWLAAAIQDGEIVGVLLYQLMGDEVTKFSLKARCFYYLNSEAKYLLLNWIARHIDQAETAEIWLSPSERPETWFSDMNVEVKQLWVPPMARVLDVKRLNGLPAGPGEFKARVFDPFCPWNEGCWSFQSENGALHVTAAKQAAMELTIQALSALVYGTHDVEDFPIRQWGSPDSSAVSMLKKMFPDRLPYLHLFF